MRMCYITILVKIFTCSQELKKYINVTTTVDAVAQSCDLSVSRNCAASLYI